VVSAAPRPDPGRKAAGHRPASPLSFSPTPARAAALASLRPAA